MKTISCMNIDDIFFFSNTEKTECRSGSFFQRGRSHTLFSNQTSSIYFPVIIDKHSIFI